MNPPLAAWPSTAYDPLMDGSERLLVAGLDDWSHAADIGWLLHLPDDRMDAACQVEAVILDLVDRGWVVVGDVTDAGFAAWPGSAANVSGRVRLAWSELDHDPAPGDVCWLANTPSGDARARELLAGVAWPST